MEKDLKIPKSYSLDPIIPSLVTQAAAMEAIKTGEKVSDSELVNQILLEALSNRLVGEDIEHVRKLLKKIEGKK